MIQDLSGSWCIKGTGESTLVMDSPVPDRSWITDLDRDHPKGTQPKCRSIIKKIKKVEKQIAKLVLR